MITVQNKINNNIYITIKMNKNNFERKRIDTMVTITI